MALISNGNDVVFTLSTTTDGTYTAVGSSTSCSFTFNNSLIDITDRDSESYITRTEGRKDWSVSTDSFMRWDDESSETTHASDELLDFAIAGTALFVHFGVGADIYTGQVLIDTTSISATSDEAATTSVSFVSTGAITKAFAA